LSKVFHEESVVPIFMHYPHITGSVTSQGHEEWIELTSWHWGISRDLHNPHGHAGNREHGLPMVHEIVVTKHNDSASAGLIRTSLGTGAAGEGQEVKIHFCKTDTEQPEPYLEMVLTHTLVSNLSMASNGERPTETLTLTFTALEITDTPMGAANDTGSPDRLSYDLTKHKGC
jgi:type VI secretion system secreted protein Hcp